MLIGTGYWVQVFSLILDSPVGFINGHSVCWRFGSRDPGSNPAFSRGRQLVSFRFENLLISCLCQSIEINNNKHVYHQSQVRKPIGSGVKWAECSLIIGTGCWVKVFSLILDGSMGFWVGIRSAGGLVPQLRILHSAEQDNLLPTVYFRRGISAELTASGKSSELFSTCFEIWTWNLLYTPGRWHDTSSLSFQCN